MSDSVTPWTVQSMEFPGQNTEVDSLFLIWGIFWTQGSNPGLPLCRLILYQLSHKGNPLWKESIVEGGEVGVQKGKEQSNQ